MRSGRGVLSGLLIGFVLLASTVTSLGAQEPPSTPAAGQPPAATPAPLPLVTVPQPSFDVLRLEHNGIVVPYNVWFDWLPVLKTTPDGGAWVFFSAQAKLPDGVGPRRLYGARFDPVQQVWMPARALPGGDLQFGPTVAVSSTGVVHVVYSDRDTAVNSNISTLLYTYTTEDGSWADPVAVAPDPNAGHQMMPSLAIAPDDSLHLIWRDQRAISQELRDAMPANADLFASDLIDGAWTEPVPIGTRLEDDINAGWPHLAVDGDRLVAVWSVYKGTTSQEMLTATRVDWSARPLADPAGWATPASLIEPDDRDVGGRQIELKADPTGGVMLLYSRYYPTSLDMYLRKLPAGSNEWGEDLPVSSGDFGYLSTLAMGEDGTAYIVFNAGRDRSVKIGGLQVKPGATGPFPVHILTPGEAGLQVRAASTVSSDGRLWIAYFFGEQGSNIATEVRTLRGARTE